MRRSPRKRGPIWALGEIQLLAGKALNEYGNDVASNRAEAMHELLGRIVEICIAVRSGDDPGETVLTYRRETLGFARKGWREGES